MNTFGKLIIIFGHNSNIRMWALTKIGSDFSSFFCIIEIFFYNYLGFPFTVISRAGGYRFLNQAQMDLLIILVCNYLQLTPKYLPPSVLKNVKNS